MRGHRDLVLTCWLAPACALLSLLLPFTVLRLIFALPLCLFLPGYAIAAAAFNRQTMRPAPLALFSLAVSLAILPLAALTLNYLGGLRAGSWALLLVLVVLAASRLAAIRRPRPGRASGAPRLPRATLPQLLLYGAGIAAAGVAVGLAFHVFPAKNAIGHTEMWIATRSDDAGAAITVDVRSDQQRATNYFLRVRVGRSPQPVIRLLNLVPGEERSFRVEVPRPARDTTATASLFRQSDPERVYRRVYGGISGGGS
jgi:Protein of unknown function (DUF1616)